MIDQLGWWGRQTMLYPASHVAVTRTWLCGWVRVRVRPMRAGEYR